MSLIACNDDIKLFIFILNVFLVDVGKQNKL